MLFALLLAGVPIVVIGVLVGLRSPVGALVAAYAAIVPLGSAVDLPLPLPPPFDTLSSIVGVLASAALLAQLALVRRGAPRLSRSVPLWLVFLGLSGMTFAWSVDPAATSKELFLLASVTALYVVAALLPITPDQLRRIGTAIIGGATAASLLGLALFVTGHAPVGKSGAPRFLITGDDPNPTAAGLLLPLVLAVWRALDGRRAPIARIGWASAATAMGLGIVLTGSRGGIVAALIGVIALGLQTGTAKRFLAAGVVVALVGFLTLALAPAALQQRLANSDSTGRTEIWRLGLSSCSQYCLAGSGWGTFPDVYQRQFRTDPRAGGFRTAGFRAHNIWLQALIELGVVGLIVLVLAFAAAAQELLALPRAERAPPLAALVALAVASSLVSNLTFKYFWLVFMYAAFTVNAGRVGTISPATAPAGSR
jgi:O-antigen ligase